MTMNTYKIIKITTSGSMTNFVMLINLKGGRFKYL
jgi:hypothetical protein